jgi:hypothetical protein
MDHDVLTAELNPHINARKTSFHANIIMKLKGPTTLLLEGKVLNITLQLQDLKLSKFITTRYIMLTC